MEIRLFGKERFRAVSRRDIAQNSFIDIEPIYDLCGYGMSVDFYPRMGGQQGNFQIREKEGFVKVFHFEKPEYINEHDFGWWSDASLIWSNAPQDNKEGLTEQHTTNASGH